MTKTQAGMLGVALSALAVIWFFVSPRVAETVLFPAGRVHKPSDIAVNLAIGLSFIPPALLAFAAGYVFVRYFYSGNQ